MYKQKPTQESRILDLLIERKGEGVFSYELAEPAPNGLGILQYNARIFGLRKKGHKIISDRDGHYILQQRPTMEEMRKKAEQMKLQASLKRYETTIH